MSVTERILEREAYLAVLPAPNSVRGEQHVTFKEADERGERPNVLTVEEGEFLYSLARLVKPERVLETGTCIGISTRYISLALSDNGRGVLATVEIDEGLLRRTQSCMEAAGYTNVNFFNGDVTRLKLSDPVDFVLIDDDIPLRLGNLVRICPHVTLGGIICVHDLSDPNHEWWGGIPEEVKNMLKRGELRPVVFPTVHGLTMFQKRGGDAWGEVYNEPR